MFNPFGYIHKPELRICQIEISNRHVISSNLISHIRKPVGTLWRYRVICMVVLIFYAYMCEYVETCIEMCVLYVLYCVVLRATIQAYYLIFFSCLWRNVECLGSIAASFTAAVEVCANGSATHQSWSPSRPTADRAPHSTMESILNTHTHKN